MQLEELSLELSNACLLKCIHCSSGSSPKALPNELTYDEHLRLLFEAHELGASVVSFSGGDPLLYPDLSDLVMQAIDLGYKRVLIYTTGHNYGGRTISKYSKIGGLLGREQITWIFSLHSHHAARHRAIMNEDTAFHSIVWSIEWLTGVGQGSMNVSEDVEVHMVPTAVNYKDIPDMRVLCNTLGVKKLSLLRFVPQTRGKTNADKLAMTKAQFAEMQFLLHQEAALNGNHPVEVRMGCPIDFRHAVGLLEKKAKPCHAGDDLMLVRPQGNVHPCAAWKSLPSDSNIKDMTLKEIWENSKVFNTIRLFKEVCRTANYDRIGACDTCKHESSCLTGCPAQRLHAYGSSIEDLYTVKSDPLCPRGD